MRISTSKGVCGESMKYCMFSLHVLYLAYVLGKAILIIGPFSSNFKSISLISYVFLIYFNSVLIMFQLLLF